jgi:hypothetical protein
MSPSATSKSANSSHAIGFPQGSNKLHSGTRKRNGRGADTDGERLRAHLATPLQLGYR